MESNQERLEELQQMTHLNDEEMTELIALSPPGTFKELPHIETAGLKDFEQAVANNVEVGNRSHRAFELGCYIEVLALRSQSLELFLRQYLAAHEKTLLPADDKRTLGALISDCERCGLQPPELVADLRAFNADRITGLHHYLLGATGYASLEIICERSDGLVKRTIKALSDRFGRTIEST